MTDVAIIEGGTGAVTWGEIAATQWRPIGTAPKDGTSILIYSPFDGAMGAWWAEEEDWSGWHGEQCGLYQATHWMPLPGPPR